jgi:hypothetical protein
MVPLIQYYSIVVGKCYDFIYGCLDFLNFLHQEQMNHCISLSFRILTWVDIILKISFYALPCMIAIKGKGIVYIRLKPAVLFLQ